MALGVIGVIVGVGLPKINNMLKNNSLVANIDAFTSVLIYARTEAVTRETAVIVCASGDAAAAVPKCDSTNWHQGWVVFVDDGGTVGTLDAANTILRRSSTPTTGLSIHDNLATAGRLQFGKTRLSSSAGMFTICATDTSLKLRNRAINISSVGRVSKNRSKSIACL